MTKLKISHSGGMISMKCKLCKGPIKQDEFRYWTLGFCSISCMILNLDIRVAKLESKTIQK
jgi:hypothetical protein